MKIVYVAGPYRNKSEYAVYENIHIAGLYALQVWKLGAAAICPHKNTSFFGGALEITDDVWLAGDLEIIKRCDAVYALPNWTNSNGACAEVVFAREHNIPVLYSYEELQVFLA